MTIQLIVDSHSEADQVLDAAAHMINQHTYISVNDLLELVGQVGRHDQERLGWTDLNDVVIDRTVDGLSTSITFPAPSPV